MKVETVRWLASTEGQGVLSALPDYRDSDVFALTSGLREAGLDADQVAATLTQKRLRERAQDKFGEFAEGMLFTADGLEQATRLQLAAQHGGRFAKASTAQVYDLGCGIGADAIALSALGVTVHAVDADPVTAAIADVNLRPWPDSRAHVGRAEDVALPVDPLRARAGVWLDPARRISGVADSRGRTRRVFRLDEIMPSWQFVIEAATAVPATGAKLSPSLPHDAPPLGTEAQWTSWRGEVLECVVWWGPLVHRAGLTAQLLSPDRSPVVVDETMAEDDPPTTRSHTALGPWLYESDRAVTRAGLLGALTAATGGTEIEAGLGYVTAEREVDVPFARRFRVLEAMPYNVKVLRGWLRERHITDLTIKKRGLRLDEEQLRRQLRVGRTAGDGESATVLLTRVAGEPMAIIVERAG